MNYFLYTASLNREIDWLFLTDNHKIDGICCNIKHQIISEEEFWSFVNEALGLEIKGNVRKICDLRPAFGHIFKEAIESYSFWGYSDLDIIWGKFSNFISKDDLSIYDIVSSRVEGLSGHFTIFRNKEYINNLYKTIPNWDKLFQSEHHFGLDELHFTKLIKSEIALGKIEVKWDSCLLNEHNGIDSILPYSIGKWKWINGQVFNDNGKEVMYLHFMNWKTTFRFSPARVDLNYFYISFFGIHRKQRLIFLFFNPVLFLLYKIHLAIYAIKNVDLLNRQK